MPRRVASAISAAGPATATDAEKPAIGTFGFDESGLDPSVSPGNDFWKFANGQWEARTDIPGDMASYGTFERLQDLSDEQVRELMETAARQKAQQGTEAQQVGDCYAAFLDQTTIEKRGLEPIRGELDEIKKAKPKTLAHLLGHEISTSSIGPFSIGVWPDKKDPAQSVLAIFQGTLGLPARDYYLNADPALETVRKQYLAHLARMLGLAGLGKSQSRAKAVFDLEKKLAEVHWTLVESDEADKTYNKMTREALSKLAPGLDWVSYFQEIGFSGDTVVVSQPSAVSGIVKLLVNEPFSVWQDYFIFHTLSNASDELPKAFGEESFSFQGRVLGGTSEQAPRWKRAVAAVSTALGEAVGKLYVAKYFPPEAKAAIEALVQNEIEAMGARIDALSWMAPETKRKAREKLASFRVKMAYPSKWRDYSGLSIKRDSAYANFLRATGFEFKRNMAKLGRPVDVEEWHRAPMMVGAYSGRNEIAFTAAILQPPFFDPNADAAVNYGAIGAVIGHEISHHFDDQGRRIDASGRMQEWWTEEDVQRFTVLTRKLVDQYSAYEPLPGKKMNGELTLSENIADLAGLTVAFDAYHRSLGGVVAPVLSNFTGDQRFFLGFAQVQREKFRDEELTKKLLTDSHSPARFRTAMIRNLDAWYEAFEPDSKDRMYLAPLDRVRIW